MELIAYQIHETPDFRIEPAIATRGWMDATRDKSAYRCLPLTMANQLGWVIPCPIGFEVYWNGDVLGGRGLTFKWDRDPGYLAGYISDHFGEGLLTFSIPFLIRTPPGYGLLVRGPTNAWLPNAHPLDGFVETDWNEATFTMNWRIAEPGRVVRFEAGFPIAMLQPYPAELLAGLTPVTRPLAADPALEQAHLAWREGRRAFATNPQRTGKDWQLDYMRGRSQDGQRVDHHRTRSDAKPFQADPPRSCPFHPPEA